MMSNVTGNKEQKAQIEIFQEADYNARAAQVIVDAIKRNLKGPNDFCSVGLSGGSTPGGIYRELSKINAPWRQVKLFLGDERWVNETDPQSNARMVRETLLGPGSLAREAVFFVPDTTLDPATGAVRYADTVVRELGAEAKFSIMLLGVGEDGHTASIFPKSELIKGSSDLYAIARHPQNFSMRITVSRRVLENSKLSLFLAKGSAKSEMLRRILMSSESEEVLPTRMYLHFKGEVRFLLDQASAREL